MTVQSVIVDEIVFVITLVIPVVKNYHLVLWFFFITKYICYQPVDVEINHVFLLTHYKITQG